MQAHRRLPAEAPPLRVYLDRIQARADLDFYEQTIRPALLGSRWLILLATPDAAPRDTGETDWIAREIADFTAARGVARIRVVHAGGAALPALPGDLAPRLAAAQEIDLRGLFSPLPRARAQEDWESLLATLFDLSPDQMPRLRREEERARRNLLAGLAGALAGAAVFATALSGFAIYRAAETRRIVERTAAVMGGTLDPYQVGACDGMEALWAAGATRRAGPAMRCRVAAADTLFDAGDGAAARRAMGSWDSFLATLPHTGPDLAQELASARHLFELTLIQYDHHDATGDWLGGAVTPPGLPTLTRTLDEVARALTAVPDLDEARTTLDAVLWPMLDHLETAGDTAAARALMIRAARMLEPQAETRRAIGGSTDDDWLTAYGLLARRIAFFERAAGALETADTWSQRAVDSFAAFAQNGPDTLYQRGLAEMVRGQVLDTLGQDPGPPYALAVTHVQAALDGAPPDWATASDAADTLAWLSRNRAP